MTATATASVESALPSRPALGQAVARGAFWTVLFAVGVKLVSLVCQIVAARFLTPAEFGYAATALSVVTIISAFLASNLQRVLVQRETVTDSILAQAFWLALAMNTVAAVLLAASAPFAAAWLGEPRLRNLVLIIALAVPIMGLHVVYSSNLYRQLRFRAVSFIQFAQGLMQNGLVVVLAVLGGREYSLIVPILPAAALAAVAVRLTHGALRLESPRWSVWRDMLASSRWVMLNALVTAVQGYGTNLVVAAILSAESTGYFFWSLTLSSQFVFLLCSNVQTVLFPALSRIAQDPLRLREAFQRTCRVTLLLLVPMVALQISLARPVIHLVFGAKWLPAAELVQWLSLGALTQPLQMVAMAALMGTGRFRPVALLTGLMALITCGIGGLGASWFGLTGCAAAVGAGSLLMNVVVAWLALKAMDLPASSLGSLLGRLAHLVICITLMIGPIRWWFGQETRMAAFLDVLGVIGGWGLSIAVSRQSRADVTGLLAALKSRRKKSHA